MKASKRKIYCAGPLFTDKEREEMEQIARSLEGEGYLTFLPQRDGLELSKCVEILIRDGKGHDYASRLMSYAIFALDIYQVLQGCDALVANLNGRVPDEGTVAEAAMAWSRGKPVVGYKADSRTAFGGQDNPLVAGLFEFNLCPSLNQIANYLGDVLSKISDSNKSIIAREEELKKYISLGEALSSVIEKKTSLDDVLDVIIRFNSEIVGVS